MVTPRVCPCLVGECPGAWGSLAEGSVPKLGRFTTELPPLMSTPRTAGVPEGTFPAPPGPAPGEMPDRAAGSEPCPESVFPAPGPAPFMPLPGPVPRPMLLPPPAPPRPGWSPPEGDMASEPVPPLLGSPTLGPGWLEITAPAVPPLPPLFAGAKPAPASSGAPKPVPFLPKPEPADPEPPAMEGGGGTILLASNVPPGAPAPPPLLPVPPPNPASEGGGGTTLGAPSVGAEDDAIEPVPLPPDAPTEGGGATTLAPSEVPTPLRAPRGLPLAALAPTVGGGATTLAGSEVPAVPIGPFE